jgi:thymidine phosphorylase
VLECIELLRGEIDAVAKPVLDLSIELAARMIVLAHLDETMDAARARIRKVHESGAALESFRRNVAAQAGDPHVCDKPANVLPLTETSFKVESPRSGFIVAINAGEIGHAIAEAGGGRIRIDDKIDPRVGFISAPKIGDEVRAGELIGSVYCARPDCGERAAARIKAAYTIGDEAPEALQLIKEVIE